MGLQEIETAIVQLKPGEVAELSQWLSEFEAELWDRQIEADSKNGKLDQLVADASAEFDAKLWV